MPDVEKVACPRCGYDAPSDPSRTPDGDHLVLEEGPLELGLHPDFFATNSVILTMWCSTRRFPSGSSLPSEGSH